MGRISLNTSVIFPVHIQSYPVQASLPFQLQNHTDELVHLAIFDYEQCRDSNEAEDALFSIDADSDNMREVQEDLPLTTGNLYLVKAYFQEEDEVEMIIQKTENAQTLNLEILLEDDEAIFEDNDSYRILHHSEADRILDGMQM